MGNYYGTVRIIADDLVISLCPHLHDGLFARIADAGLVGDAADSGRGQQWFRQAHVDARGRLLEFEPQRLGFGRGHK
jgi:hypothetical protein